MSLRSSSQSAALSIYVKYDRHQPQQASKTTELYQGLNRSSHQALSQTEALFPWRQKTKL